MFRYVTVIGENSATPRCRNGARQTGIGTGRYRALFVFTSDKRPTDQAPHHAVCVCRRWRSTARPYDALSFDGFAFFWLWVFRVSTRATDVSFTASPVLPHTCCMYGIPEGHLECSDGNPCSMYAVRVSVVFRRSTLCRVPPPSGPHHRRPPLACTDCRVKRFA